MTYPASGLERTGRNKSSQFQELVSLLVIGGVAILGRTCVRTGVAAERPSQTQILAECRFDLRMPHVVIPVRCGNVDYQFFLDTGAVCTRYDRSFEQQLGAPVEEKVITLPPGSAPRSVRRYKAPEATFLSLPIPRDEPVVCVDLTHFREWTEIDYQGILGMDFLEQHVLQLGFTEGRLRALSGIPEDAGKEIPFFVATGDVRPMIRASIDGSADIDFLIDTGSDASMELEASLFESMRNANRITDLSRSPVMSTRGTMMRWQGVARGFRWAGVPSNDIPVRAGNVNTIGLGYLRQFDVTFDFANRRLYLNNRDPAFSPMHPHKSGLRIFRHDGEVVVDQVAPFSPAVRAGIRPDDTILTINGVSCQSRKLYELRWLLENDGERVELEIVRRQERKRVELFSGPSK